jgi:predicted GIY-YIG superfamily endonuclease
MTTLALTSRATALYRHFAANGTLLYVGITCDVAKRQQEHARSKAWWPEVASTTVETHPDRYLAATAERAAIAHERPAHNVDRRGVRLVPRPQRQALPLPADIEQVLSELVDSSQVAGMLGLSSGNKGLASYLRDYPCFPPPVKVVTTGRGQWWYAPHVRQWRELHPPRRRKARDVEGDPS